jgi:hypothetical protein
MPQTPFHPAAQRLPSTPRAARLVAGVLALLALMMGAMVVAHWPWLEQAWATEQAPLAWLQSSLLWSAATLALLLALTEPGAGRGWALVSVLLLAAALDERFMGHEWLKDWLLFHAFGGNVARMGLWGDAPILVYAAGGLGLLVWLRRLAWPKPALRLMVAAVTVGCGALALDLATQSLGWQTVEECGEALAEALFDCGLLLRAQALLQPAGQVQPDSAA